MRANAGDGAPIYIVGVLIAGGASMATGNPWYVAACHGLLSWYYILYLCWSPT